MPNANGPTGYDASMAYTYLNQGLDDSALNNGGDPITSLGSHGGQMGNRNQNSHYMDVMFGQNSFGGYNHNFFPGGGAGDAYSAQGSSTMTTRKAIHGGCHDDSRFMKDACCEPVMLPANLMTDHQVAKKFSASASHNIVIAGAAGVAGQTFGCKKRTRASEANQAAKPQPKIKAKSVAPAPTLSEKHVSSIEVSKNSNNTGSGEMGPLPPASQSRSASRGDRSNGPSANRYNSPPQQQKHSATVQNPSSGVDSLQHPVLDKLRIENNYNPKDFVLNPKNVRFFIIKSYSEDDIHRSIKYSVWCSTERGNKRLDQAFLERGGKGLIYLFYSVNGSGHFCGMAQMVSCVDYNCSASIWTQDKWKGQFKAKWIYVKDVPNSELCHIRLENNANKPVTNSRDTQEVQTGKGKHVLKIMHNFRHTTSIFGDFLHCKTNKTSDAVHGL